jgi:GNAT-like C-terminal domain/N-acyltransferase N-terminal domain
VFPLAQRLSPAELSRRVDPLGFRDDDAVELRLAATAILGDQDRLSRLGDLVPRVQAGIGVLDLSGPSPWASEGTDSDGVLEMLALLVSADEVVAYQLSRGITAEQAWHSLADLGQQVWVHRLTYGSFGLHTYGWLRTGWSGGLSWLGRLQFNLQRLADRWVLSCHIPRTGPLSPELVDDAFEQARCFFRRHFADYPTTEFYCSSWLLDPELAAALPGSNIAAFQQRWTLFGEPHPGDEDAVFFTFARRGGVDLTTLPRSTSLQRVIIDRLQAGQHWGTWKGLVPQNDREESR